MGKLALLIALGLAGLLLASACGDGATPAASPAQTATAAPTGEVTPVQGPSVGIDTDPSGNTAGSLGEIDLSRTVACGDTFDVDLFIQDVLEVQSFDFALQYDSGILNVMDKNVSLMLEQTSGSSVQDLSDLVPDGDGFYGVRGRDASSSEADAESGSGVAARLSLKAVGAGVSSLTINISQMSPIMRDFSGDPIEPADESFGVFQGTIRDAEVEVTGACPAS